MTKYYKRRFSKVKLNGKKIKGRSQRPGQIKNYYINQKLIFQKYAGAAYPRSVRTEKSVKIDPIRGVANQADGQCATSSDSAVDAAQQKCPPPGLAAAIALKGVSSGLISMIVPWFW